MAAAVNAAQHLLRMSRRNAVHPAPEDPDEDEDVIPATADRRAMFSRAPREGDDAAADSRGPSDPLSPSLQALIHRQAHPTVFNTPVRRAAAVQPLQAHSALGALSSRRSQEPLGLPPPRPRGAPRSLTSGPPAASPALPASPGAVGVSSGPAAVLAALPKDPSVAMTLGNLQARHRDLRRMSPGSISAMAVVLNVFWLIGSELSDPNDVALRVKAADDAR